MLIDPLGLSHAWHTRQVSPCCNVEESGAVLCLRAAPVSYKVASTTWQSSRLASTDQFRSLN